MNASTLTLSIQETTQSSAPRARALRGIRQAIEAGTFETGGPLPPERELAEQLDVSRTTLRSALLTLEDEGWIRSNGGRLRFVNRDVAPMKPTRAESKGNWLAQAVGVVTYNLEELPSERESGWALQITRGALGELAERQLHVVNFHPASISSEVLERIAGEPFGGFILTEISLRECGGVDFARRLQASGVRLVVYGDEPDFSQFNRVSSDHYAGAELLVRHFVGQGRTRIAMLWANMDDYWFAPRRAGYEATMLDCGLHSRPVISFPRELLRGYHTADLSREEFDHVTRVFAGYLAEYLIGPDALDVMLVPYDGVVPYVTAACRFLGRVPGEDILIAGYDNLWRAVRGHEWERTPPAATIDKNYFDAGVELVRLLLALDSMQGQPVTRRLVEPTLVLGSELNG